MILLLSWILLQVPEAESVGKAEHLQQGVFKAIVHANQLLTLRMPISETEKLRVFNVELFSEHFW